MEEVLVRREIPWPKDRAGRPRSTELLRSIRQLVQAARQGRGAADQRRLTEVGLCPRADRGVVEVVLHFGQEGRAGDR